MTVLYDQRRGRKPSKVRPVENDLMWEVEERKQNRGRSRERRIPGKDRRE